MIKKEYYVDTEIVFQTKLYLGWTYLTTKEFFKKNKPKENDELIVVTTHYPDYKYSYELMNVKKITNTRITLHKGLGRPGPSYYYTGKNCRDPMGQSRLIPLSKEISNFIKKNGDTTHVLLSRKDLHSFNDMIFN